MKKFILSAATLAALLMAPAALADDQNQPNDQPKQHDTDKPDMPKADNPPGNGGGMNGPADKMGGPNDAHPDHDAVRERERKADGPPNRIVHKTVDPRVIMKFRANIRAPQRFHFGIYARPPGWYAHRWVYGERLPPAFFARDYWIADFLTFGLIAPPDGYVWVRYGDDALLIDEDTGEVIRVEYDVFY